MINWAIENVTESPLNFQINLCNLKFNLSNFCLLEYVNEISALVTKLKNYPCHTQAVERCIKLVSEAYEKVCGLTKRNGFIRLVDFHEKHAELYER